MPNNLVTWLMLNSTNFENNLGKSTKQVQEFQRRAQTVGKNVNSAFSMMSNAATKLVPAIGGAMGAFEAFNKTVNSTQTLTDELGRITQSTTSSIDYFFASLAKGDFSNFISGLKEVISNAREAYNAIDDLGTFNIFKTPQVAKIESEIAKYKYNIKAGIDVEVNQEKLKKAEGELQKVTKTSIEKNREAYYTSMRKVLGEQGGRFSNQQIDKVFSSYYSYSDFDKRYKEYENKVKALNNRIAKGTSTTYGFQGASYTSYSDDAVKAQTELKKLQQQSKNLIALHEVGDEQLKEAFQYRTAMYTEESNYYNKAASDLKVLNKEIKQTGTVTKQVAQDVGKITMGDMKVDFTVYDPSQLGYYIQWIDRLKKQLNDPTLTSEKYIKIKAELEIAEKQKQQFQDNWKIDVGEIKMDGLTDALLTANNQTAQLHDRFDAINEVLGITSSVLSNVGDSGTNAFLSILQSTIPLISAISALSIAEGVENASRTSKNWIELIGAVAGVTTAIVGALSTKSKFANGGIVGGNDFVGDKRTVRVNSGEMILNKTQQANLFNMINDGSVVNSGGVNGNVTFRIQGKELVGVLNNYNNKRGKIL